ncbi:MAG: hypothetical protein ABI723_12260 [Bacteroidia bacterium]
MTALLQLKTNELSTDILKAIKLAFNNKEIEIVISEARDETNYLLSSPANKANLEKSIYELEQGKGVTFTVNEFLEKYGTR